MRHLSLLSWIIASVVGLSVPSTSNAQNRQLCFDVPGITHCIEGRFQEYWEHNGGLAVFGYPLTGAAVQQTAEGAFLAQTFERNRFELHPEHARPYDVLLGRLGTVQLEQHGRTWVDFPKGQQTAGCLWFAETGHSLCDQEAGIGFRSSWEGHGVQDPALTPSQRSLALFGLPLSEPVAELSAAGASVLVQWFERARLEWHPDKPREYRVLLGLLGSETLAASGSAPPPVQPPPPPPAPPADPCAGIAAPQDAAIEPNCVTFGGRLLILVYGFDSSQEIGFWITGESGFTVGTRQSVTVDEDGAALIEIDTSSYFGYQLRPGNYVFVAQDVEDKYVPSIAPFRVIP